MPSASEKIIHLRQLLAERFGEAHPAPEDEVYLTGLPALDELGVPRAAITEILAGSAAASHGSLLLYAILHTAAERAERVALIDGSDSFRPHDLLPSDLPRILWTRCHSAKEALQAVDLTARDGNFPLIILLLALNPADELRRIPSTAWHRLQMLVEKSAATLLVFTPSAQVGCARLRLAARGDFPLSKLHRLRTDLLPDLHLAVERRRMERKLPDETLRRSECA